LELTLLIGTPVGERRGAEGLRKTRETMGGADGLVRQPGIYYK